MVRDNEYHVSVTFEGAFNPVDITASVGVKPTECWQRGDICPRTQRQRQASRWTLHSRLAREHDLEAHLRDVLAQLEANPKAFRQAALEFSGCVRLAGYFYREYPGLHFDRDITEALARYALAVDFDFYWLCSQESENSC